MDARTRFQPERIAGLLFILVLALTLMALLERQVRKNLKGKPLQGLYPEGRVTTTPTGPRRLRRFRSLTVVIIKERGETHRRWCELNAIQRRILHLLNLTANDLRTFKRRCTSAPQHPSAGSGTWGIRLPGATRVNRSPRPSPRRSGRS